MSTEVRRIGKFELHRRLERSNTTEVWKAFDTHLQRSVAIKFFHTHLQAGSESMMRFVNKAEALAALHHSNIVQLHSFHFSPPPQSGNPVSLVGIVMEYVEGDSLCDYISGAPSAGKTPPAADIVQLFTSISLALDYAHQHGIVHGNIKPSNILLSRSTTPANRIGEPMLTDFGLARLLRSTSDAGTPFYLSPEQIQGAPGSERSDIYALGVILYEIYTGMLPFRGNRPVAIMMQHISALPTSPDLMNPTISPALANVILRSLAKDPQMRFPTASSMTAALAQALNLAMPKDLSLSDSLPDAMSMPVYRTPLPSQQPSNVTSPLSPPITLDPPSPRQRTPSQTNGSGILETPSGTSFAGSISGISSSANTLQSRSTISEQSSPVPSPTFHSTEMRRQKDPLSVWFVTLLVLLLLSSLGTLLFLAQRSGGSTSQLVGYAFYVNSGQLNEISDQGINDELQIDLSNIPDPAQDKGYYAWLLGDSSQSESAPILLGRLTVNHGSVHFLYTGDGRHTNLLGLASRFLITEEDVNSPTSNPLLDTSTWHYYAEIPQTPSPNDKLHFSMLDHLRHLIVESPELQIRGLHGGMGLWLLRNTSTIVDLATSATDAWHKKDTAAVRDQIIRILDYIDGASFVHTDVPSGTPLLADPHTAQIALLGPAPHDPDPPGYSYNDETPPGYVYLIGMHMDGAILSPQTTPDQRKLAIQINAGIDTVRHALEQVVQDAKVLVTMASRQLLQSSSLSMLDDIVTQAQNAYTGRFDPSTGQSQGGAVWIYGNIQRLAAFEVKTYVPVSQ